jgi:hypothetical protein
MPEQETKVVEADRFVLRDSHGIVRANLGTDKNDSVALKLYDSHGRARIEVIVGNDGTSGLQLWDEQGMPRVILALDPDQPYVAAASLSLNSKDGRGGVIVSVAADGSPAIDMVKDGKVFLAIPEHDRISGQGNAGS